MLKEGWNTKITSSTTITFDITDSGGSTVKTTTGSYVVYPYDTKSNKITFNTNQISVL